MSYNPLMTITYQRPAARYNHDSHRDDAKTLHSLMVYNFDRQCSFFRLWSQAVSMRCNPVGQLSLCYGMKVRKLSNQKTKISSE